MLTAALCAAGLSGCASRPAATTKSPPPVAQPAPPPLRPVRPAAVRALYVNSWAAGSHSRMAELIRLADATEINAFIIDVKESDTFLTYGASTIPLAKEIGADQRPTTNWLKALLEELRTHQIYCIARIVTFKDHMLAEKKPEFAIRHINGGLWRDRQGGAWVNPYDRRVWDYNVAIAQEALELGFAEIQWDYVRFPDVTDRLRATMAYPHSDGKSRPDNVRDFILYSKEKLKRYHAPITANVFGLSTHMAGDADIGQQWETLIVAADSLLPMVYPSHYRRGFYDFPRPHRVPYELVRIALTDAVQRSKLLAQTTRAPLAEICPWLEAMSIRGRTYGPPELRSQIQATYDAGLKCWALWNPGSSYAVYEAALRPADGSKSPLEKSGWLAPQWTPPAKLLSPVIKAAAAAATAAPTPPPPAGVPATE